MDEKLVNLRHKETQKPPALTCITSTSSFCINAVKFPRWEHDSSSLTWVKYSSPGGHPGGPWETGGITGNCGGTNPVRQTRECHIKDWRHIKVTWCTFFKRVPGGTGIMAQGTWGGTNPGEKKILNVIQSVFKFQSSRWTPSIVTTHETSCQGNAPGGRATGPVEKALPWGSAP